MVKPAFAQTIPSVPTFIVQPVGPSWTVPTTYSLNQNTGKVVAQIGYTVEYPFVEVTIKNQPFTPYFNTSIGQEISLRYNIQISPHGENSWTDICSLNAGAPFLHDPEQSVDSNYTNLSIDVLIDGIGFIPVGTQTDIQVQAMIGYITLIYAANEFGENSTEYSFVGQTGSWSNTQTVNIPANIPLSPTPTPTVPEFPTWIILPLFAIVIILISTVIIRKRIPKKNSPYPLKI